MNDVKTQDLFDLLGISFREDSYTEVLANVFRIRPDILRAFLAANHIQAPEADDIRLETRIVSGRRKGEKTVPDLVVEFKRDKGPTHFWIMEAKIEAREGSRQTERYAEAAAARSAELSKQGVPLRPFGFLTLTGEDPENTDDFVRMTYEPLCELLDPGAFDHPGLSLAVACLRDRLRGYYNAKEAPVDVSLPLRAYVEDPKGLVRAKDRFHWLTHAVGNGAYEMEASVAQSAGSAYPLQVFTRNGWRTAKNPKQLEETFRIHMEAQYRASSRDVVLLLHYETYPYQAKLSDVLSDAELQKFVVRRSRFTKALGAEVDLQGNTGAWKPPQVKVRLTGRNQNQVSAFGKPLSVEGSVREFRTWLREGLDVMAPAIDRAVQATGLGALSAQT